MFETILHYEFKKKHHLLDDTNKIGCNRPQIKKYMRVQRCLQTHAGLSS